MKKLVKENNFTNKNKVEIDYSCYSIRKLNQKNFEKFIQKICLNHNNSLDIKSNYHYIVSRYGTIYKISNIDMDNYYDSNLEINYKPSLQISFEAKNNHKVL
jgi:hypothetical protein